MVEARAALEDPRLDGAGARASSASTSTCRSDNGAQRARAALGEGRTIEEIYRGAVEETAATYPAGRPG